jgi:hypothetical protein
MSEQLNMPLEEKRRQDAMPDSLEEAYPMTCASCGHEQRAKPSLMMQAFGLNMGSGDCLECGVFLHLWIEDGEIKSELFDTFKVRMAGER